MYTCDALYFFKLFSTSPAEKTRHVRTFTFKGNIMSVRTGNVSGCRSIFSCVHFFNSIHQVD
jgi:hypothetical protein